MADSGTRVSQNTADHPAKAPLLHGCAPQAVLAVPHEVKPQAPVMSPPVLPDTSTVVGTGLKRTPVPEAHETPICWFEFTVDSVSDFGTVTEVGAFWMRMPPNGKPAMLGPFPVTVVFLTSKPEPSRRIPPAVLLLTLTWSRRTIPLPSAHSPGEPPVMVSPLM